MNEIIRQFQVRGESAQCSRFGCGHINETYLVTCDSGLTYILQKINKNILISKCNNAIYSAIFIKISMCKIYSKWIIDLGMTVETVKFTK